MTTQQINLQGNGLNILITDGAGQPQVDVTFDANCPPVNDDRVALMSQYGTTDLALQAALDSSAEIILVDVPVIEQVTTTGFVGRPNKSVISYLPNGKTADYVLTVPDTTTALNNTTDDAPFTFNMNLIGNGMLKDAVGVMVYYRGNINLVNMQVSDSVETDKRTWLGYTRAGWKRVGLYGVDFTDAYILNQMQHGGGEFEWIGGGIANYLKRGIGAGNAGAQLVNPLFENLKVGAAHPLATDAQPMGLQAHATNGGVKGLTMRSIVAAAPFAPFSRDNANQGIINGLADMFSGHAVEGAYLEDITVAGGGELGIQFSRGSSGIHLKRCTAMLADLGGLSVGITSDGTTTPVNSDILMEDCQVYECGIDHLDDHPGLKRAGINLWNINGDAIVRDSIIESFSGRMQHGISVLNTPGFSQSGNVIEGHSDSPILIT